MTPAADKVAAERPRSAEEERGLQPGPTESEVRLGSGKWPRRYSGDGAESRRRPGVGRLGPNCRLRHGEPHGPAVWRRSRTVGLCRPMVRLSNSRRAEEQLRRAACRLLTVGLLALVSSPNRRWRAPGRLGRRTPHIVEGKPSASNQSSAIPTLVAGGCHRGDGGVNFSVGRDSGSCQVRR